MSHLNDYLVEKREAVLARNAAGRQPDALAA